MRRTYTDNAQNRRLGRVGMPIGSMPVSRDGIRLPPKEYVGNAQNRRLGRVGLPCGSMPEYLCYSDSGVFKSSNDLDEGYSVKDFNRILKQFELEEKEKEITRLSKNRSTDSDEATMLRTYKDNAQNRRLGRVGMPLGSMPVSLDGTHLPPTEYVYNAQNKSLARVGLPQGSLPQYLCCSDSGVFNSSNDFDEEYSDKDFKKHVLKLYEIEEMEREVVRLSKNRSKEDKPSSFENKQTSTDKVYEDNVLNRRLERVGKHVGLISHDRLSCSRESPQRFYVDNYLNRALGRVGKPLGTMPVRKKSKQTEVAREIYERLKKNPEEDVNLWQFGEEFMKTEFGQQACDVAVDFQNRQILSRFWQNDMGNSGYPRTSSVLLREHKGTIIGYKGLDLLKKIGHGQFGDVFFAKWKGSVVALKKLRIQSTSKRLLRDFTDEIREFCLLDHPNIVKCIGVCALSPNVAIVMELMSYSLYEVLHIQDDKDLSSDDRLSIIRQMMRGLQYLHARGITHCNLKPSNVLVDMSNNIVAKITNFGLSMLKDEKESATFIVTCPRNIESSRYSAPEVLRGSILPRNDMMKADMYSVSLVVLEIVSEEESFASLAHNKICKRVGEEFAVPQIPKSVSLSEKLIRLLKSCWIRDPHMRPNSELFLLTIDDLSSVYEE